METNNKMPWQSEEYREELRQSISANQKKLVEWAEKIIAKGGNLSYGEAWELREIAYSYHCDKGHAISIGVIYEHE